MAQAATPANFTGEEYARLLDAADPLAAFRERFYLPAGAIYMDGNSLGLLSRDAEESVLQALAQWKALGIDGWLRADAGHCRASSHARTQPP